MEEVKGDKGLPKKKKKPNLLVRLLAFLLTLALILGAVALVAYRDRLNFDAVKRWFTYRSLERDDGGKAESFPIEAGAGDIFADLDGDLLVCSTTGAHLYSGSGKLYAEQTVLMDHPVVDAAGKAAVVYDAGGQSLLVFSGRELVFTLPEEEGRILLSAALNPNGWMAVAAQESGYKGAVTVYDAKHEPVVQIGLSSRFVLDAAVSPDNKSVAVLTAGLEGGNFESRVDLYRLDRGGEDAGPDWSCPVGSGAVLELRWDAAVLWALGESGVYAVDPGGALSGSFSYGGRFLKGFSLGGGDTAAVLLGKYRAGSGAELTVVDAAGQARAVLPVTQQVLSLSAAGRYVAVLTADRLEIYDQDLALYSTLTGTQGARQVLMRGDGTAMLIGGGTARLYVPE